MVGVAEPCAEAQEGVELVQHPVALGDAAPQLVEKTKNKIKKKLKENI